MNYISLLERVSSINKKYENIAEITGENFNVFRILGLSSSEVRTHSAFIAELLNPKGSHNQKQIFLKLFCEELKINNFFSEGATVTTEKHTEYGNIDIIITDINNKAIIIENKIYAIDQEKQLLRYSNYGNLYHKNNFYLVYLTLDGKEASPKSKGITLENNSGLNNLEIKNISYSENIKNWLEKCKEKAVNHHILRETLTQYINLIKHLTHQTMNEKMTEELILNIISNSESINSAGIIADSWNKIRLKIMDNVKIQLENEVAPQLGMKIEFDTQVFGKKDSGFWFYIEEWKYCIYFYLENDFDTFSIGIHTRNSNDKINDDFKKVVNAKLSNISFGKVINANWVWCCNYKKWEDLSWGEVQTNFPKIVSESVKTILENFDEEVLILINK